MISKPTQYYPFHSKSTIIYAGSVLLSLVLIISLPLIRISVSVQALAQVRPISHVNIVRCITAGRIKEVYAFENKKVKNGDILYVIESELLPEQEKFNREKIALKIKFLIDVQRVLLLEAETYPELNPPLNTALYQQSLITYLQKFLEAQTRFTKAKQDYDRQHKLYQQQVIAASEFENFRFELQKTENAIHQVKETQRSLWQGEQKILIEEKRELESQLLRLQKEKANLSIKAPISGTLQNLAGVYPGTMVFTNQELAQISPDTSLLAIAYVQPSDIGLVQKKMDVRLQVDAFNYNQWGMATGKVIDVAQDIKIIDNKPVFEVRCSLDKDFLQLKNGYKGFLKKGMTVHARFIVAERSLWQLLYDKVDDWVNPNR